MGWTGCLRNPSGSGLGLGPTEAGLGPREAAVSKFSLKAEQAG